MHRPIALALLLLSLPGCALFFQDRPLEHWTPMQGPPTCAQFVALGHLDIAIASAITAGGAYYALSDEAPGVEDGMERASVAVGAAIGAGLYAWSAYDGHREKRACRAQVADYAAFVAH